MVGFYTSRPVWIANEFQFASLSRVHTIELRRQLQNVQKGNLTICDYLLKIKIISDELSAMGHSIDESDQVTHILDGLPEEYDLVVINVATANLNDNVFVSYVYGLLLNIEMRLAQHCSNTSLF